jgi:hypothetical protein
MHLHEQAARLHAEANPTDPFAYARMSLYLRRGFEDVKQVKEDALKAINIRTMARKEQEKKWHLLQKQFHQQQG